MKSFMDLSSRLEKKNFYKLVKKKSINVKNIEVAEEVTKAVLASIKQTLLEGNELRFFGFGTFYYHYEDSKMKRDPRTGIKVESTPYRYVKFHPCEALRRQSKVDLMLGQNGIKGDWGKSKRKK